MCPCQEGRIGAFFLTFGLYWAWLLGLPFLIGQIENGNPVAIGWAVVSVTAASMVWAGISAALSHDDGMDGASAGLSLLLGALAGWAFWHGWFLDGNVWKFHLSRAFWLSLMASEVFNLWLNFRGAFRQARPAAPMPVASPRWWRRRTLTITEVIEGQGQPRGLHHSGSNTQYFPPVIGQQGQPVQITYVQDERGNFIPVQPPETRLPVSRRLR